MVDDAKKMKRYDTKHSDETSDGNSECRRKNSELRSATLTTPRQHEESTFKISYVNCPQLIVRCAKTPTDEEK